MIYLINFALDDEPKVSCACQTSDGAETMIRTFDEQGITLHKVNWICYMLQKHNMPKLATLLAVTL